MSNLTFYVIGLVNFDVYTVIYVKVNHFAKIRSA